MEALQIACAPFATGALTVAARTGIADLLHERPQSAEELAAAAGLQAPVLLRVLRLLSSLQIFRQLEDGRFENNKGSEPLRTDHPASMRHFCILAGSEYYRSFAEIMHTAQTGESAFHHLYGESIYAYMDRNREAGRIYDRGMEDLARPVGHMLAEKYDFGSVSLIADIGGGSGALLKGILGAYPSLRGICLDRQDVCDRGHERLLAMDKALAERLTFVPGDFFAGAPNHADLYLLKNVLHNWADESSEKILSSIRDAVKPEARLLVIEPLVEEHSPGVARLMDDLFQMVVCEQGTTARTETQMRRLLKLAGFTPLEVISLPTGHQVIVSAPSVAGDIN
jgi:SAM-dependent methyltransferase